jgi:tripartite-type tricarboxylate transporter receptor subunit TctC
MALLRGMPPGLCKGTPARTKMALRWTTAACVAFAWLAAHSGAAAQPSDNFYANRPIKVIVTTQAGGEYDLWMRLIAPYMTKYIPGTPALLVQNMPGAGSIVGANFLFNVAPRDGTVIGMIGRNLPFQAVLGEKSIRFDITRFNWIGNPEVTNRVCAQRPIPEVTSAHDLFRHQLMIGGAGAGGALSTIPQLLSRMLGMRLKLVEGYQGPRDILLAMERGELNGLCMSVTGIENLRPGWIETGKIQLLFNMEQERLRGRGVPSIFEFTRTEEERRILSLFSIGVTYGRPLVAPPDVPAERVAILRTAFERAMADPDLLEQARKIGLEFGVVRGEALEQMNRDLLATPRDLVERMKAYTQ